ncbi:hypothetical protein DVDV_1980 [Desulfovibrio sp. DV]|uniref:hypothetical protein n=1 Tax=Desulfovibrio sp. DV TaxID=1844708 RepID=UPI000961D0DC|nr:hypothetical protein [Desulfovibrio sp. DV]OLN27726.1 hypothetical protein DVDV_1980 [Desulfovibrio sp. DV]
MEWIFIFVAAGIAALAGLFALTGNRPDGESVKGHFDFDRYKQNELSKRGLFDKTKW